MTRDALRVGRVSETGRIYLITTVTHGRKPWFVDFDTARQVIQVMRLLSDEGGVASLAWVLMPDHLHWLIQLGDRLSLSVAMGYFKGRSARRIGSGWAVWQKGFHDHALRREEDLAATARYIVANPLRAGLVRRVGDYPHWDAVWL